MESLKLENIKRKPIRSLTQAAQVINKELELNRKDLVTMDTLRNWYKKGVIKYLSTHTQGSAIHISDGEIEEIKQVAFYNKVLGVRLDKIEFVRQYINNLKNDNRN